VPTACMPPKLCRQSHCRPHAPEVAVVSAVVSDGVSVGTTSAVVDAVGAGRVIVIGSNDVGVGRGIVISDVGVGPAPMSKSVYIWGRLFMPRHGLPRHHGRIMRYLKHAPRPGTTAYLGQAREGAWSRPRCRTLQCKGR
jgi:hypothetical protein